MQKYIVQWRPVGHMPVWMWGRTSVIVKLLILDVISVALTRWSSVQLVVFWFFGLFFFFVLFFYFALRQFCDIQEKLKAVSQRKEWICCSSVHFSQWKMGSLVWAFHWLFPKIVFCYGNIRGPEKNNGYRSIKNLLTPFLESFLMARKWKAFHIYLYDLRLALLLKVEFMQLPLCHLSSTGFEST